MRPRRGQQPTSQRVAARLLPGRCQVAGRGERRGHMVLQEESIEGPPVHPSRWETRATIRGLDKAGHSIDSSEVSLCMRHCRTISPWPCTSVTLASVTTTMAPPIEPNTYGHILSSQVLWPTASSETVSTLSTVEINPRGQVCSELPTNLLAGNSTLLRMSNVSSPSSLLVREQ